MPTVLRLNDFVFNSFQGILFTQTSWALRAKSLSTILNAFAETFDSPPTVLPVPDDAPPEIPRIILRSTDKQWSLEVAANRINYRWVQMADAHQQGLPAFCDRFCQFLPVLLSIERTRVGRVAIVLARYLLAEQPAFILSRHFCRDIWLQKALPDSEAFELHSLRKTRVGQAFDVNSWIRFKSGQLTIPETPVRPIILVEQDVNTLAEKAEVSDYKEEEITQFFNFAQLELEQRFRSLLD